MRIPSEHVHFLEANIRLIEEPYRDALRDIQQRPPSSPISYEGTYFKLVTPRARRYFDRTLEKGSPLAGAFNGVYKLLKKLNLTSD